MTSDGSAFVAGLAGCGFLRTGGGDIDNERARLKGLAIMPGRCSKCTKHRVRKQTSVEGDS